MTWAELKKNILDLGFDDELPTGLITSCNRAINVIRKTIEIPYREFIFNDLSITELPTITPITKDTADSFEIQTIDRLIDLVPLLSAHYAWLDDDVQKATTYFNEYDDLKNQIMSDFQKPNKVVFGEGLRW